MEPNDESRLHPNPIARFFAAPVEARSYRNLLYLALAFPLGLAYFVFLVVGLSLGLGLMITWIGIPILALVFAASWGLAALERWMAIHMLGAPVPPMVPAPSATAEPQGFWQTVKAFLANPVTWKGMGYLLLKFPLGVATFVIVVTLLALAGGFMAAPFVYPWQEIFVGFWVVDTLGEALVCAAFGVAIALIALNVFNAIALLWRQLAKAMLGSPRFATAASPATVEP